MNATDLANSWGKHSRNQRKASQRRIIELYTQMTFERYCNKVFETDHGAVETDHGAVDW